MGKLIKTFFLLAIFMTIEGQCAERAITDHETYSSCFRIINGNTRGSGTCFHQDEEGNCYIITNNHVAGKNNCTIEKFEDGNCKGIEATNIWTARNDNASLDVSILKVSAKDAEDYIHYYVPIWNSDEQIVPDGDVPIFTIGSPKAYWMRLIEGRAKLDGKNNIAFKPTAFGGQSGSGLFYRHPNGKPYIIGLVTWRTADEWTEVYGGLAQPISRIVKAMSGEVSDDIGVPLPVKAVPCPFELSPSGGKRVIINGNQEVIQCATKRVLEVWTCEGCGFCEDEKADGVPEFRKYITTNIIKSEQYPAINEKLEIHNYPTTLLMEDGKVKQRWIGYDSNVKEKIIDYISLLDSDVDPKPIPLLPDMTIESKDEEKACNDEVCRLLNRLQQQPQTQPKTPQQNESTSGKFNFFSLPKSDEENSPKSEKNENSPNIHKENQPEKPKNENQPLLRPFQNLKPEKNEDESNGGLFNWKGKLDDELQKQKDKLQNELDKKIKGLAMTTFWLMFLACTLALFCYKFTSQILKCFWWGIKWCFKKINECISNIFNSSLEKVVEKVKETTTTVVTKTTSKKE